MCDNQYHNDFTLEELHMIRDSLKLGALHTKLNEMIENYCDHDFQNTYNEREVWQCAHCGIE